MCVLGLHRLKIIWSAPVVEFLEPLGRPGETLYAPFTRWHRMRRCAWCGVECEEAQGIDYDGAMRQTQQEIGVCPRGDKNTQIHALLERRRLEKFYERSGS